VEVPLAVVPPREAHLVRVQLAIGVARTGGHDGLEAVALLGRHVGGTGEGRGVVDVRVGARDVQVAGQHVQVGGARTQRVEEGELVGEEGGVQRAAVGHVDAGHAVAADRGVEIARLTGRRLAG